MRLIGTEIAGYTVIPRTGHYLIYKNGKFVQSCDCGELNRTIDELLNAVIES